MRIAVCSYFFYPEGTPRATRTYELVREFARLGHEVTAYVPDYEMDYAPIEAALGARIKKVAAGFLLNAGDKRADSPAARAMARPSGLKRAAYRAYQWATGGRQWEYAPRLAAALRADGGGYELVVSIGLPFSVHAGAAAYLRELRAAGRGPAAAVADYGDPYYYDPMERKFILHRALEARALAAFDYVAIPHERIRDCFTPYAGAEAKLRIIPQGFRLDERPARAYRPNPTPTFAYAGVFYPGHGDPGELLGYLAGLKRPFRLALYTDARPGSASMACLAPYLEALKGRVELRGRLPRTELLEELAGMDFLVSIDWPGVLHTKLIDYKIAGRPILSYEPGAFDPSVVDAFLDGDYAADFSPRLDLSRYDIRSVAAAFLKLADPEART